MDTFDKIAQQIKNEDIKQTPRWYFIFKNTRIWIVFLLSISIGAIAFSVILFSIQQSDFELLSHVKHSKLESFLVFLPFFWVVILLVFSIFSFYSLRSSKKAYKYSLLSLLSLSTFISILLGTLFFISGGAQKLEHTFANTIEIYNSLQERKLQIWMNPKEGMLAGSIENVKSDTIYLKDFSNNHWKITFKDVFIPPFLELESGEQIKIVGLIVNDKSFVAKEIRPWKGFRKNRKNKNKKLLQKKYEK
ncbi:MAG TPA: hypothetical protein EYG92_09055 [Lutibacter sp.]|nr:hypothetical protein [Lutibacter sp.]